MYYLSSNSLLLGYGTYRMGCSKITWQLSVCNGVGSLCNVRIKLLFVQYICRIEPVYAVNIKNCTQIVKIDT